MEEELKLDITDLMDTNSLTQKNQKYHKWSPIGADSIDKTYYCEGLHDDYEGFRIILKSDDQADGLLKILFENHLAYRNIDEGDRLRLWDEHPETQGKHSFYNVENSEWVQWFLKENSGKYEPEEVSHYSIHTPNDVIDILSIGAPTSVSM